MNRWHEMEDKEKVVVVAEEGCENAGIQRGMEKLYGMRFA